MKVEDKEEEEEIFVGGDQQSDSPPPYSSHKDILPHHEQHKNGMYMRGEGKDEEEETSVMDYQQTVEEVRMMVSIKQEEPSPDVSTDGPSNGNPPERCPRRLYSRNYTQEDLTVPHHDQSDDLIPIKAEIKMEEEEMSVMGDRQFTEDDKMTMEYKLEKSSLDIRSGERLVRNPPCLFHPEESSDPQMNAMRSDSMKISSDPSNPKTSSLSYEDVHADKSSMSCLGCGKSFTTKAELLVHLRSHTSVTFTCLECGRSFTEEKEFLTHKKSHTPYTCPQCKKSFTSKEYLIKHQKMHTGDLPFSCSECGKCFISNTNLVDHQRIHTGERPFSCRECGKSFTLKGNYTRHQRVHTEECRRWPNSE